MDLEDDLYPTKQIIKVDQKVYNSLLANCRKRNSEKLNVKLIMWSVLRGIEYNAELVMHFFLLHHLQYTAYLLKILLHILSTTD